MNDFNIMPFQLPLESSFFNQGNLLQETATQQDLEEALDILNREVDQFNHKMGAPRFHGYKALHARFQEKAQGMAEQLRLAFKKGLSGANLRLQAEQAAVKIQAVLEQINHEADPNRVSHQFNLIGRQIEALDISAVKPAKMIHLPMQLTTQEFFAKEFPEEGKQENPARIERTVKEKTNCTREEIERLQAVIATVHIGGIEAESPLVPPSLNYQGVCRDEYSRIKTGMAIQSMVVPLVAIAKIEHEIGEFIAAEQEKFCNQNSRNRRCCEKSAEVLNDAVEWTKSHTPESVKQVFRRGKQMAEQVADDLEANYYVPKEITKEALNGVRAVGEHVVLDGLLKAASKLPKFPRPKPPHDLEKTLALIDKVEEKAKTAFAAKKGVQPVKQSFDFSPMSEQALSVRNIPSSPLLPSPLVQKEVKGIGEGIQRNYRQFKKHGEFLSSIPFGAIPKHQDVYFHATSELNVLNILKSGKIKRMDANLFQGVFVASRPEPRYGDFVFAFNRSIENSSKVLHAEFDRREASHFVGFSKSIPVTKETLEYIAIKEVVLSHTSFKCNISQEKTLEMFAEKFSSIAGRQITVVPLQPRSKLAKHRTKHEGVHVPEEWPLSLEHEIAE